jgi:Protein of unknown function (DUF4446)
VLQSVRTLLEQNNNLAAALLAIALLNAVLVILLISQAMRVKKLSTRLEKMSIGTDDASLPDMITEVVERLHNAEHRADKIESAVAILQARLPSCVQRVGMVRYDAFDNVGGQQSFSLAMLDAQNNGVVLTSVYSRMDIRVYAKSISNGTASHPLSEEEEQALRDAK